MLEPRGPFSRHGFLRNITTILGGSAAAQLLILCAMPLLTRLYSPSSFAISQAAASIMTVVSVGACLRYEMALASGDREAIPSVAMLCLALLVPVSLLSAAGGLALVHAHLWRSAAGLTAAAAWALPIGVVALTLTNAGSHLLIRTGAFAALSRGKLLQAVVFAVTAIAIGLAAPISTGILIADLAGRAAIAVLIWSVVMGRGLIAWRGFDASAIKAAAGKYARFPLLSLPGGILSVLGGSFNTLWMLSLFDAHSAGAYALVERVVAAPVALVAASVAQAYQGRLVGQLERGAGGMAGDFTRLLLVQLAIGAAIAVGLAVASPVVFPLVFGPLWREAGQFAAVYGIYVASGFVAFPFNIGLVVLGRQRRQFAWECAWFALLNGAWGVSWLLRLAPLRALALVVAAGVLGNALFLWLVHGQLRRQDALATS